MCLISTVPCLKETAERETAESDEFELDENMVSYLEQENDSQDTVQDQGQGNYDPKFLVKVLPFIEHEGQPKICGLYMADAFKD